MSTLYEYCYQCPKCKSWVEATRKRCSCGEFLDHLMPVRRLAQERFIEEEKERDVYPHESSYGISHENFCERKEGHYGEVSKNSMSPIPGGFYEEMEEDEYEYGGADTDLGAPEEEEEEESTLFYFNACRYDNGCAIQAKTVNFPIDAEGRQQLLLGRNLFIRNTQLFFHAGSKELDERYKSISRNNALLSVDNDRLYIELYQGDGARKAAVYVGQTKLEKDEVRELHHGDRVRFGGKKTIYDGTIDIEIVSAMEKERYGQVSDAGQGMKEMNEKVDKLYEKMSIMQDDLISIKQFVAQINPADLQIRRGEDAEAYEKRLAETMPQLEPRTRQEYVEHFLEGVLKKGSEKYNRRMAFFQDNDRRFHLLYQAAFFECACVENGLEDYAGPMSFLGKAIEGFVMGEMADVAKTFNQDAYDILCFQKKNRINQYDVLGLFQRNDDVRKILQAADYDDDEWEEVRRQVKNALEVLHSVRIARNDASHCDPDTEKPAGSAVDAITKQRYGEIKKRLLDSEATEVMHQLYLRTQKKGQA